MNNLTPKISIIGCGNVGVRFAYAAIIKGLSRSLVMVDLDRSRLEGEVMDLSHGAPYYPSVEIAAGDYPDIKGSDLVVITAGKKQSPEQTRVGLVKDNIALYKKIIPEVVKYAPEAILLIVSNPVDILSYAAYKISGKKSSQVIGSGTVLDSARLRFLISRHCGMDTRNIHAYILGEHGDTEFAFWSKAMVGGVFLSEYCGVCRKNNVCDHKAALKAIFEEVRDSAYKIIELKGETSYGIGLAQVRIARAIIENENAVLPVSTLMDGFMGLKDVYLSIPAVVNRSGIREQLYVELDSEERANLTKSADTLKKIIKECGL